MDRWWQVERMGEREGADCLGVLLYKQDTTMTICMDEIWYACWVRRRGKEGDEGPCRKKEEERQWRSGGRGLEVEGGCLHEAHAPFLLCFLVPLLGYNLAIARSWLGLLFSVL